MTGSRIFSEMKEASTVASEIGSGRCSTWRALRLFHDYHARVLAQFPMQDSFANVDGIDAPGAMLQQTVGETAGRSAHIGANPS